MTHPQRGFKKFGVAHAGLLLHSLVRQDFVECGLCGVVPVLVFVRVRIVCVVRPPDRHFWRIS